MTLTRSMIRNAATTPLDARLMFMSLLTANADGSPRAGVIGGANPSIVSSLPTMNVAIAAAEFATTKGKNDGVAIFTNDGTVNVAIATAPASNSRIDVIYVKHNDDTTGDATALPVFAVATGTAAASPAKPSIPTGALELATLRVYSGTTATNGGSNTLTNTYQMTAARGGAVYFRKKTDLDLWTTAVAGQDAVVIEAGISYTRAAGSWWAAGGLYDSASAIVGTPPVDAPILMQTGNSVLTADVAGNVTVTFPKAFPNALLSFQVIDGDPIVGSNSQRGFSIYSASVNTTLSAARVAVRNQVGAPLASVAARLIWIAVGC